MTDFQISAISVGSKRSATTWMQGARSSGAAGSPANVRSLLEDRFKLKIHKDTRDLQRYTLMRQKPDAGSERTDGGSHGDCAASVSLSALPNALPAVSESRLGRSTETAGVLANCATG